MFHDGRVGYRKLRVWQVADQLAFAVYNVTTAFPKEERYGMTSQLRRAVLSVPTNVVEGCGRQGKRELKQFINLAMGSLAEVDYTPIYEDLEEKRSQAGKLLWGFYRSIDV